MRLHCRPFCQVYCHPRIAPLSQATRSPSSAVPILSPSLPSIRFPEVTVTLLATAATTASYVTRQCRRYRRILSSALFFCRFLSHTFFVQHCPRQLLTLRQIPSLPEVLRNRPDTRAAPAALIPLSCLTKIGATHVQASSIRL